MNTTATIAAPAPRTRFPLAEEAARGSACSFSLDSLAKLRGIMYRKPAPKGAVLFWEGDVSDRLIFVHSGRIRITKTADSGRSITLYLLQQGDLYGQPGPFQSPVHAFNAEVIEDGEISVLKVADLEVLLWQHGDLAIEFMKWMGLMNRLTQAKFRDLMLYGKTGALSSLLIRLCNSNGVEDVDGIRITLKIHHGEMADMIGATRECVNRMLSDMRKADVIAIRDGQIVVKKMSHLRDMCRCENCPTEICRM